MKVTGVGAKQNKAVIAANTTHHASQTVDVTPSTTLRNLTQHMKNGGHRSSSSRFLDRLASKVSLVSLTSSKVSNAPNKTSLLRKERASVNATLIELKNATDRLNKTAEKRSVNNSTITITDRASSFFQTLPALLVNTTSNVTSWAKRLFGTDKNSSARVATKKVVRDTTTAEFKSSVNTTESKTSALNSTGTGQSTLAITSDKGKKKSDLSISTSSLLNLTATSILKRDIGNLTADMPTIKGSNSSIINSTKAGIKRDSKIVQVPLKKLTNSTVESQLDVANLSREISEKTTNSSSLISESSATLSNRTRRHSNGMRQGYRVPSRPAYSMPVRTTPNSISVYPVTPAYGMPAAAPSQNYGMIPTPAYGMAPAASTSSNGMAPALSAPAAASVYSIPAPYAAPATNYGMTSAPPGSGAPVYGYTTPAPYAPPAVSAPVYEMAPVAPVYSTPAPYAPYVPAAAYGMAPAAPAPAYGMALTASSPAYGMGPPAPTYTTPAPYVLAYEQSTESYYTAPLPSYTTTSAPYNLQPNVSPYGVSSPPVVSYPAQPYGSGPSRPSPTGSPWF